MILIRSKTGRNKQRIHQEPARQGEGVRRRGVPRRRIPSDPKICRWKKVGPRDDQRILPVDAEPRNSH